MTVADRVSLGAVGYLNARPLVYGLDRTPDLFDVRFDVPSTCAALLHAGDIDVGMIPSIEYLRGPSEYRIVPGMAVISEGPVASVALFSRVPIEHVRRIGLDTSSRTSAGLTRVLCREAWHIDPSFTPIPPGSAVRVEGCDAALVIGDPALFLDAAAEGFTKIDLGSEWTRTTGLPFVWAFWAARPDALDARHLTALTTARDEGVAHSDEIANEYGPERASLCRAYLRENIKYTLGPREIAGVERYYELAAARRLVDRSGPVRFFDR